MTNQTSLKNPISIPHFDPSFFYYVQDSSTVTLFLIRISKSFDSEIHILQFIETTLLCQWYEIWPLFSIIHFPLPCMKKQQTSLSFFYVCSKELQQHHFLV
ncbi:hypothetical protein AMTRI_Chr06g196950 [Amborella trichopoda]